MSIEENIARIATALEKIAACMETSPVKDDKPIVEESIVLTPKTEIAGLVGKTTVPNAVGDGIANDTAAVQAAIAPPPPPPKAEVQSIMTMEELNKKLVEHFVRIGNDKEPIDKIMREEFKVQSIKDLHESSYQLLLDKVAALPPAA